MEFFGLKAPSSTTNSRATRKWRFTANAAIGYNDWVAEGGSPKGIGDINSFRFVIGELGVAEGGSPKGIGDSVRFRISRRRVLVAEGGSPKGIGDHAAYAASIILVLWRSH